MSRYVDNPDWYRVVYNLAALRANRAAKGDSTERHGRDLEYAGVAASRLIKEGTRQARHVRLRLGRTNRARRRFFVHTVVPSARLLLVGVRCLSGEDKGGAAMETIDDVLGDRDLAARVHYNAACLLSTLLDVAGKEPDEIAKRALDELQRFVWKADPGEAALMGPWAAKDPTLAPLRERYRREFDAIFDFAQSRAPTKSRPSSRRWTI